MDSTSTNRSTNGDSDPTGGPAPETRRLQRAIHGRMLSGLAAGLGDYLGIDPTIVRGGFVVATVVGGLGIPLYLAGWLLVPEAGTDHSVADDLLHQFHLS